MSMGQCGTAVILCGGKSGRAGREKQLLIVKNKIIGLFIAGELEKLFGEILIVTNKSELYESSPYRIVPDIHQNCGPLGGLHAGLFHSRSRFVYLTACDMPNVSLPYIRWMKENAAQGRYESNAVVFRRSSGSPEPFNGFYGKDALPVIDAAVKGAQYRFSSIYTNLRVLYAEEKELPPFINPDEVFLNLNRPEDIEHYLKRQE